MGEMDVDIEIDSQADNATVQLEAFNQLMKLVSASPVYQQQVPLTTLIQLSPIPHKRQVLDVIKQASDAQAASAAQAQQLSRAMAMAKLDETRARTAELQAKPQLHAATAFAKASDAVTYAHQDHADAASAGIAAGLDHGQTQQAQAFQTSQDALQSDQQGGAQPAPDAGQAGQ